MFLVCRFGELKVSQQDNVDDDDITIEVEDDEEVKSSSYGSKKTLKVVDLDEEKKQIIKEVMKEKKRYNQMQKIPEGTFTMGTDEIITKDGEAPARK